MCLNVGRIFCKCIHNHFNETWHLWDSNLQLSSSNNGFIVSWYRCKYFLEDREFLKSIRSLWILIKISIWKKMTLKIFSKDGSTDIYFGFSEFWHLEKLGFSNKTFRIISDCLQNPSRVISQSYFENQKNH